MANIIEYDIKVNSTQAQQEIGEVGKEINDATESVDELTEALSNSVSEISKVGTESKGLEEVEEKAQNATKAVKGTGQAAKTTSTGVKAIGTAFKAIGIGIVVAALAKLTDMFLQNQKVADFFATAMETLNIVFSDFTNFIVNNFGKVTDFFTDVFENPVENIKALGTVIKDNLIERFNSFLKTIGLVGTAIKQVFEGDFAGAADTAKEAAKELVDVATGVNDSFDKGVALVTEAGEAISKYATETLAAAEANVELANSAAIAVAELGKQLEISDIAAEQQRQIRDDITKTAEERTAASDKLLEELDKREAIVRKLAAQEVALAQAELAKNDNTENRIALIEAESAQIAALATIEGQRSEQLAAANALRKEIDEEEKADAEKKIQERLEREELDRELALEKQELDAETAAEIFELERQRIRNEQIALLEDESLTEDQRAKIKEISAKKIAKIDKEEKDAEKERDKILSDQKLNILDQTAGQVQDILGENSAAGKAAGIASATINTFQGVTEVFKTPTTIPEPFGTISKVANAAVIAASGFAAVKKIVATKVPGGSSGGGGGSAPSLGGVSAPSTPTIDPTRTVETPSLSDSLVPQIPQTQNNNTVRAYVVQGDVEDANEADAKINQRRSF